MRHRPPAGVPSPWLVVMAVLVGLAVLAGGCTDDGDDTAPASSTAPLTTSTVPQVLTDALGAPVPADALVVGAVLDLTSPRAAADVAMGVAVQAEVARLQAAGGVAGRPVALVVADSGGTVLGATNGAGELADRHAVGIVLGCDSDLALAAADVAQGRGVLALAPCAIAPELGLGPPGWLTFQLGLPSTLQGRMLADYVVEAGRLTAITLSEAVDLDAVSLCAAFLERYRALGGRVIAEVEIDPLGVSIDQVAETVARFEGPGMLVSCLREPSVSLALFDLNASGATAVPIVLSSGGDSRSLVAAMPGDVLSLGPPAGALLPEHQSLLDTGAVRGATDLGGVAAVQLIVEAMTRAAGATDGPALALALEQAGPLELAIGSITFSATDHAGGADTGARVAVLRGHAADGSSFQQERRFTP